MNRFFYSLSPALVLGLLMGFSGNTLAQETEPATAPLPESIQHLKNKGLDIVREFPVGAALTGWVVSYQGSDRIVYSTADGEFLISGVLLDAQGNDLTEEHQKNWLPKPSWGDLATSYFITEPSLAANLATDPKASAETNAEISVEAPKSTIYMFYDANCPFCHLAWVALQPYRQAGLEVRWIPVAYLKPDSRDKAAALLSTPKDEQAALLEKSMQAFGKNDTAELSKPPSTEDKEQLQTNMNLMQSLGLNGTPGWVWLNEAGEMQAQAGMLRLPKLPSVTGLPAQKHTEPTLMRFR